MGNMAQWRSEFREAPTVRYLFGISIAYGIVGVPSALAGSLVDTLRFPIPFTSSLTNFFMKGMSVGVLSAIIVGEACRKYQ